MAAALGVNQRWLFTGVFALGALLAGLGGALPSRASRRTSSMDLAVVADAFVVVVVGGLGSIPGAFLAALLIGEIKAFCIGLGYSEAHAASPSSSSWRSCWCCGPGACSGRPAGARRAARIGGAAALRQRERSLLRARGRSGAGPGVLGRIRAGAAHRHPGVRAVRGQPAFPHRTGGMASFGHAAYFGLGAYGAACSSCAPACRWSLRCSSAPLAAAAGAAAVRLVLRAALRRLPRDADARVRADRVVDRVPVGRDDRRLERPGRRVAAAVACVAARAYYCVTLLPVALGASPRSGASSRSPFGYALRARARFAAARGSDRHRRSRAAMARVHRRRDRSPGSPARCTRSPRAPSRPRRSRSRVRWTRWSWCCSAACRR